MLERMISKLMLVFISSWLICGTTAFAEFYIKITGERARIYIDESLKTTLAVKLIIDDIFEGLDETDSCYIIEIASGIFRHVKKTDAEKTIPEFELPGEQSIRKKIFADYQEVEKKALADAAKKFPVIDAKGGLIEANQENHFQFLKQQFDRYMVEIAHKNKTHVPVMRLIIAEGVTSNWP